MKKTTLRFKSYCPDQILLLPADMKQWLPEGDLAYFIMDVVSELDLSTLYNHYSSSRSGQPPFNPRMMTSLILYAYCVGLPSSRKIVVNRLYILLDYLSMCRHLLSGRSRLS